MKMLRAFGHRIQNIWQHHATMLQDVVLKSCVHLARPLYELAKFMPFFNRKVQMPSKIILKVTDLGSETSLIKFAVANRLQNVS